MPTDNPCPSRRPGLGFYCGLDQGHDGPHIATVDYVWTDDDD